MEVERHRLDVLDTCLGMFQCSVSALVSVLLASKSAISCLFACGLSGSM